MDRWNALVERWGLPKLLDHARWTMLALASTVGLAGCSYFFQPKAPSPSSPMDKPKMVTRAELDAEVASFKAKAEASYHLIESQEQAWQTGLSALSSLIGNVPGPLGGVIAAGIGVITVGMGLDNRRKSGVIRDLKDKQP